LKKPELRKYEMFIGATFKKAYIETTHIIKIIDFDGGSKSIPKYAKVKEHYKPSIKNPEIWSGVESTNKKSNLIKLIHTINITSRNKAYMKNFEFVGINKVQFAKPMYIQKLVIMSIIECFYQHLDI